MPVSVHQVEPAPLPGDLRVAVVQSRYNDWITGRLLDGAAGAFEAATGGRGELTVIAVPGAMEVPLAAEVAASSGRYHAVVCLACVIRGETDHDKYINTAVTDAILAIGLRHRLPVTYGVLTVNTTEQAEARAGGSAGNKGQDAMEAALSVLCTLKGLPAPTLLSALRTISGQSG